MQRAELLEKVIKSGVVSVVRADSAEDAVKIVEAVVDGGIKSIELTYSVPRANDVIADLVARYADTDVVIGAGTVLEPTSARLAIIAGAQFIVSPTFNNEVAKICNLYQIPYIGSDDPIRSTDSDGIWIRTHQAFPGDIAGAAMIKDLKGPFPYINVMPSGGVNESNVAEWFKVGATAVSAGGGVTAPALTGDFAAVKSNAEKFMSAYRSVHEK